MVTRRGFFASLLALVAASKVKEPGRRSLTAAYRDGEWTVHGVGFTAARYHSSTYAVQMPVHFDTFKGKWFLAEPGQRMP